MKQQVFNIVFSLLLLPANVLSAFCFFRQALNLTGMTLREFVEITYPESLSLGKLHRLRKMQRLLARFFREYSSDPQKSIRLTRAFGFCTLPGFVALSLAVYSAMSPSNIKFAFIGNLVLALVNLIIAIIGKIYVKNNLLDEVTMEKLSKKREYGKENHLKNIIVYSVVGIIFFGFTLFFMIGISSISQSQNYNRSAISIQADLIAILGDKGYETANISTTYWEIDENKLEHIAAGSKGDSKFEFYGYSDDETVDLVYNRIVYLTAPDLDNSERQSHETSLSDGGKMFTAAIDNVYYLVLYKNDTVIYAYSPDSLSEINEILSKIGYLKN